MSTKLEFFFFFNSFDICHAMANEFFEHANSDRFFSHNVGSGDKHYEFKV